MGRRSSRRDNDITSLTPPETDVLELLSRPVLRAPVLPEPVLRPFTEVEDLRTWHPDGLARPVARVSGRPASVSIQKPKKASMGSVEVFSPHLGFDRPKGVIECVRRKTRKEVLFAKRKAGRGGRRARPRRTWRSEIRC